MALNGQTIPEITNEEYNELSYNSADTIISGTYVAEICLLLNRCGILVDITNDYDDTVANAVSIFQEIAGIQVTGILTTGTLQAIILYADNYASNQIYSDEDETEEEQIESNSSHYNSFFHEEKYRMERKNRKDIEIKFGNGSIKKTIRDVFMRSVSLEVDTSGNPISEIYEFVARDVIESNEISDFKDYVKTPTTSSDIQYNFASLK